MDLYAKGTGAELNLHKTERMWLGAWPLNPYQPFGIKWVIKIKILGVFFGSDADKDKWDTRVDAFNKKTDSWLQRDLSIKGRVVVATTLCHIYISFCF